MQLKQMSDAKIVDAVNEKVGRERELVTEILEYLREIELRRICLARGFGSQNTRRLRRMCASRLCA
jgi:hypothetical protein